MSDVRYSVYRARDDMPVIIGGTIPQCAKACGMTYNGFVSTASRQRHGKKWNGSKFRFRIYRDDQKEDT